ncbi:hypothetical protein BGZ98_004250, partial [Dissophora globulifera]
MQQDPVPTSMVPPREDLESTPVPTFEYLQSATAKFRIQLDRSKQDEYEARKLMRSTERNRYHEIERLQVPRSVNQFRTVESPKQSSGDSRSSPPQLANASQRPTPSNQDVESRDTNRSLEPGSLDTDSDTPSKNGGEIPAKDPSATSDKTDMKNKVLEAKKKSKQASPSAGPITYVDKGKMSLMCSLGRCHPTSSLEVGTLDTNTKRVFLDNPGLQQEVVECIKEASRLAVDVKREAQRLIGQYLEKLRTRIDAEVAKAWGQKKSGEKLSEFERLEARRNALSDKEREILDYLAGEVKPKKSGNDEDDIEGNQDEAGDQDSEEDDIKHTQFLRSFMVYLYSRNLPTKTTKIGGAVDTFIGILADMDLLNITRTRDELNKRMPFTPTPLVRSVATQLVVELKMMYHRGSHLLYDKICAIKKRSGLEDGVDHRIQEDRTAIENYIALNDLIPNRWRIAPLTSSKQAFVSFSEKELASFFWKRPLLKQRLLDLARLDGTTVTSMVGLDAWIGGLAPGPIIKNFVCDIDPTGLSNRRRRRCGHRAAVSIKSLDAIRSHLQMIKETKPKDYHAKGYLPRGSIRTDGFRVQILAYKVRERQDAHFKRLPQEDLPDRLTSTVAGTEYYLTEIGNVIKAKEDIEMLWPGKDIQRMKILTLDGGQACVFGAFAHLPMGLGSRDKGKDKVKDNAGDGSSQQKEAIPEKEEESIQNIESRLPSVRGSASSIVYYVKELQHVEDRLKTFYAGDDHGFQRRQWDHARARQMEYQAMAERLVGIVGGSLGRRVEDNPDDDPVLIGIGLGQFKSNRLSSLHSSFL